MPFQQKNSRDVENSGLGYAHFTAQKDNKPFSIREFVFMARQEHIEECWPFAQKYLRLCLDSGISITDVLPPMETFHSPVEAGKTQLGESRKASKLGVDYSAEDSVTFLSGKLVHLSLHDEEPSATKVDAWFMSDQSFKRKKGRKRKTTKTKSLADILAVAKPCALYYDESDYESASKVQNANEGNEECSLIKKHKRCDDSVTGKKMNSYKTGKNEKSGGGCNRKAGEGCGPSA